MQALVLEGGTFRPIFSCGVMDALLDHDVHFPYVIGVSAGITDGVSYVSKQKRRALNMLLQFRHDKRYIGMRNYITDRSLFGIKFAYETIPQEHLPFDWKTYTENPAVVKVGVTNANTGKIEYLDGKKLDEKCDILKATCALPLVFPPIEVDGQKYYDGGICDSIPAKKAIEDGNEKLLIVLTRPEGYIKKPSKSNIYAAKILKRKFPNIVEPIINRHEMYNEQLEYCQQLEKEGRAIILRPTEEVQIESFEKDLEKIKKIYQYGYDLTVQNMDKIKDLFN